MGTDKYAYKYFISRQEDIEGAFRILESKDSNGGKGYIALQTLRRVLTDLGEKMSEEEVESLIKEMNLQEDGKVTRKQFLQAFDIMNLK